MGDVSTPLKPSGRRTIWSSDVFIICIVFFAVAAVLASPLVTYEFKDVSELLRWTVIVGLPIAAIGVGLNHWAEASEARKPAQQKRPRR